MKTANIALFKQFLNENGANKIFCGLYKQFHFPESPESVEEYLMKVDSKDAILNAFKFPHDVVTFGPEYWLNLAVRWEKRLVVATEETNHYSAKERKRVMKEAAKPLDVWEGSSFRQKLAPETPPEPAPKEEPVIKEEEEREVVSEEEMALSGFHFFNINRNSQQRLLDGFVSVNIRSGSARVSFNSTVSEEIIKSGLKSFRIGQKGTEKALFIIFSNDAEGIPWRINAKNVCFSSKDLVVRIMDFFGIKEDYVQLKISKNMANKKDYLTYKLTKNEK